MKEKIKESISANRRNFLKTAVTGVAVAVSTGVAAHAATNKTQKINSKKGYDEHSAHVKAYYQAAKF